MFKSFLGSFLFIGFILIFTQIISNYVFEDEPLSLVQLFSLKKCISLLIGALAGALVMFYFQRSKAFKSLDKK
ncbi:hypothetical protein FNJ87_15815 [Nonlabens mediterrranea]|uniref:Lipopolysaccharide assembly protein A domain-containing protein n=1 Tax=Nonlabens mediterrranea TaxID=1419947 RepID=A0ABS0A8Q1_9FLAO|nr:hypothetical protein [Nonlabens mediterrranea]MBF4985727.1 hypothetical protein [Nonlabens mediterrranea]